MIVVEDELFSHLYFFPREFLVYVLCPLVHFSYWFVRLLYVVWHICYQYVCIISHLPLCNNLRIYILIVKSLFYGYSLGVIFRKSFPILKSSNHINAHLYFLLATLLVYTHTHIYIHAVVQSLSHVQLFVAPWTIVYQSPLSMGLPRQEYWSDLPFPSPGDLPDPGTEPMSSAWQVDSLTLSHLGSPYIYIHTHIKSIYVYS